MKKKQLNSILLTSDNLYLSEAAETYAKNVFNLKFVGKYARNAPSFSPALLKNLQAMKADYLFNFLSPIIIPRALLQTIKKAAINFHPAPPKWPGAGSASFALFERDKTFGVTAHHMTEIVDSGKIIKTLHFPILEMDTCDSLFSRALNYTLLLFYETLFEISQSEKISTSEEKWQRKAIIRKQFEKFMTLSLDDPAEIIERKIKATRSSHFPGPFITIKGRKFELPRDNSHKT